jgi:formate transporter
MPSQLRLQRRWQQAVAASGRSNLRLPPRDLLIRGIVSGAILGVATSRAVTSAVSTGQPLVGAIIFPVGLVPAE